MVCWAPPPASQLRSSCGRGKRVGDEAEAEGRSVAIPVPVGNLIRLASEAESRNVLSMREACSLLWSVLVLLFRSRASLEAEILILRHQLNIQRRHLPERLTFSVMDRLTFVGLYRLVPSSLNALTIVTPETVVRWHRAGFRSYWRWKSRPRGGRPTVPLEIRRLIRDPREEHCKPTVGRAAGPWSASQAQPQYRTDERCQVYGQAKTPAVPR